MTKRKKIAPQRGLSLPFFLTKEIALHAMKTAVAVAVSRNFRPNLAHHNPQFHIVMLVPAQDARPEVCYPNTPVYPHLLAEYGYRKFGAKEPWRHDFLRIARNKTSKLWYGYDDGSTDSKPHLLFPGDTPYWGGVKRDGIAVGCSGDKSWIDRMIAGIAADISIALAYDAKIAWMKTNEADFLPG